MLVMLGGGMKKGKVQIIDPLSFVFLTAAMIAFGVSPLFFANPLFTYSQTLAIMAFMLLFLSGVAGCSPHYVIRWFFSVYAQSAEHCFYKIKRSKSTVINKRKRGRQ